MVPDETVTSGGAPCRCPRLALSSSYGAIPETVGFLVCPVGNQQIEVLLAEGNLVDGLYTVATASRPTVGSPRSILEAAFNAPAASGIQCVLDFSASHDSQCSIVFHTASGSCFPSHTAGHGCLVARISHLVRPIDTVSGVETDVSHNARSCKDGMFIAFCAHFVLNFSPCTAGSCLFTDPCFSPILGVSNHFQTVFPSCGTESSELVFSLSALTERSISTGCFVCAGCAKAVRVAFRISCCL